MNLFALLTIQILTVASPSCADVAGLDGLLKPGHVIIFGELHGTQEGPAFVQDVACHAHKAGVPVVIGVELPPAKKNDAVRESVWKREYQDGRTSKAMKRLVENTQKQENSKLLAFDGVESSGWQDRDNRMSATLANSVKSHPKAVHLALVGNLHSRNTRGIRGKPDAQPMAMLLGQAIGKDRVTSLQMSYGSGSAWVCAPDCGAILLSGRAGSSDRRVEIDDDTRPSGHNGWFHVGAITASPPTFGEHVIPTAADSDQSTGAGEATSAAADDSTSESSSYEDSEPSADGFPRQTQALLKRFQGYWAAHEYGTVAWILDIEGDRFRGLRGKDEWYQGTVRVRDDLDPGWIDLAIEDCRCDFKGQTSQAIFSPVGSSILFAAPQPGSRRPTAFKKDDGQTVELKRRDAEPIQLPKDKSRSE